MITIKAKDNPALYQTIELLELDLVKKYGKGKFSITGQLFTAWGPDGSSVLCIDLRAVPEPEAEIINKMNLEII